MSSTRLLETAYAQARSAQWSLSPERFAAAVRASIQKAFGDTMPDDETMSRHVNRLHLEDLALACACAEGHEPAWDHFVTTYRPQLYRTADALDHTGGARDLADALYGELFGVSEQGGARQSLFRYYHGRSRLATWLRSVLTQRYVDRYRAQRRFEPLPDGDSAPRLATAVPQSALHARCVEVVHAALSAAVGLLRAGERFRLACYYAHELTLAQIARLTGEHEATVSRQLARARRDLRVVVEEHLRTQLQMSDSEVAECLARAADDSGMLDVRELLDEKARKNAALERSR